MNPLTNFSRSMRRMAGTAMVFGVLLGSNSAVAALHDAKIERGGRIFGMCAGCHAWKTAERRLGPSLAGVFGRRAGTVPGYRYSRALRDSGVLWNATTLDAWLADPKKFLPGTRMPFSGIRSARDRSDLIVFLERRARQRRKNREAAK